MSTTSTSTIQVELTAAGSVISAVLALVQQVLPSLGVSGSSTLDVVLTALESIVPLLINAAPEIIEEVKAIIDDIKTSGKATDEQLARAAALAAQVDAAWNATVAAYQANHGGDAA